MKARRKQSGLSLLELIIAMSVIAIAMFAILSMIVHSMQTKETLRELQIAKEAVSTKMEEIKSHTMQLPPYLLPTGTIPDANSVYNFYTLTANASFPVSGITDSRLTTTDKTAVGTIKIDATNPYVYEVMVTVNWVGRKGPAVITRRSLIAQ
jgi:prepilin-type N-terminal cleavage/methylation domain-containing protein